MTCGCGVWGSEVAGADGRLATSLWTFVNGYNLMMRPLALILLVPLSLALAACREQCDRGDSGCNELANKHEYSLLQAMASRLQDRQHDRRYLLFSNALESDLTVVAFPRADTSVGWVVLLTNAEVSPHDKAVPDVSFVVTPEVIDDVRAHTPLSPEVERYIRVMAAQSMQ